MSKRKANNGFARAERGCRALLRTNHFAVVNIDPSGVQIMANWKNCRQIRSLAIANALFDFAYHWTIYLSAMCRDERGVEYVKSVEISPDGIYKVECLTDAIEHYYLELRNSCNPNHMVASGWIVMLASPCCQGHTKARGKASGNPQHDNSRSTAWAPVANAEVNRPDFAVIENVPEFMDWILYPAWADAMQRLGYTLAPHIVDCADLGVPQHRVRLFMVCSRSKAPLHLQLPQYQHVPASQIIDFDAGKWSPIVKPGRAASTLIRVENGRKRFGERFVMPYYGSGSGLTGRSLDRPIGTITTLDRWAVVNGNMMRMITANEAMAAQSFPEDTLRPDNHRLTMHMTGNAVPPLAGQRIIEALKAAA